MGVVKTILFVAFIIISVVLVLMVLVQNEDNNGMGGVFGGGNSAAFGSHSASVLTKATAVFVTLFFVIAFALAFINKPLGSKADTVIQTATEAGVTAEEGASTSWIDQEEAVIEEEVEPAAEVEAEVETVLEEVTAE